MHALIFTGATLVKSLPHVPPFTKQCKLVQTRDDDVLKLGKWLRALQKVMGNCRSAPARVVLCVPFTFKTCMHVISTDTPYMQLLTLTGSFQIYWGSLLVFSRIPFRILIVIPGLVVIESMWPGLPEDRSDHTAVVQGSYRSWKFGKSWNLKLKFSRPWKV